LQRGCHEIRDESGILKDRDVRWEASPYARFLAGAAFLCRRDRWFTDEVEAVGANDTWSSASDDGVETS